MYEQVFTPNLGVSAIAGMCLQFVDDAGSSPIRSGTAKAAKQREANEGRLKGGDIPENVWVVVYFDFARGSYTYPNGTTVYYKDAGHIALARRVGDTYEIHDSEVGRKARTPYRALRELTAWFGAYGCTYAGWSTHCDGREYAKIKENNMIEDNQRSYDLINQTWFDSTGRKLSREEFRISFVGRDKLEALTAIQNSSETAAWSKLANLGKKAQNENWTKPGDADKKLQAIKNAIVEVIK